MNKIYLEDKAAWRKWLSVNHQAENEVWLVFNKKKTGLPSIDYEDAVEQALCFGWIDSLIKRLNETQYARKFTPRKADSNWSALNIRRAKKMIAAGQMTPYGMEKVEAARRLGTWHDPVKKPKTDFQIQPEFSAALEQSPKAKETFDKLAPSYQKQYITWISVAKRLATRQKRIEESIRLLEKGQKLGLK